jgi:hypothetical protein
MPTTWWQRNWKWFVPVGCLGLLAIITGLAVLLVTVVLGMIKSSGDRIDLLHKKEI